LEGARNIRRTTLDTFTTTYKLKTTTNGAVVREWPKGYSVWIENATVPEGYSLLGSFAVDPGLEVVEDMYDVSYSWI
jgi:hypothetical protein